MSAGWKRCKEARGLPCGRGGSQDPQRRLSSVFLSRTPPQIGEPASFFLMSRFSFHYFFNRGVCLCVCVFKLFNITNPLCAPWCSRHAEPLASPQSPSDVSPGRHPQFSFVSHVSVLVEFSHSACVAYIIMEKPNKYYPFHLGWNCYVVSLGYF